MPYKKAVPSRAKKKTPPTIVGGLYIKQRFIMAKIIINTEACKGCGLCTLACPKKILAISAHSNNKGYYYVEVTDKEKCTGCSSCAITCPDVVIEVER